jgi:hypothetical protein
MAQKNRANMLTDIVSNIYNNLINFITGQNAQDRFVNLLDSSPNILSDASQPNGYVSTDANNEMFSSYYDEEISRADLITDLTANLAVGGKFYRINDAVGITITLLVIAESNINLYPFGIDATTGEIGTYDITTDVFSPIVSSAQTLSQTLVLGNTSGANDIQFDATQGLLFANTSRLREGTIDAGLGGTKGIAQICGAGYELKWENGRLYVMGSSGNTIRQSLYNLTTTPTATDDTTLGYAIGSLWTLDDGTVYVCSDATLGAAVWAIGGIPNLQQVTTAGATTTVGLTVDNGTESLEIKHDLIKIVNALGEATITSPTLTTTTEFRIPDKLTGPQTFAMLSDITSGVASVNSGTNISVDNTDPANPIINSLADRYSTSSVTSNTIGNGAKTFTVDADLAYIPLQEVLIVNDPSNHMHATVTSYSGTTLVVDVKTNTGSGTFIVWVLNLDGVPVDAITGVGTANEIAYFTGGQVIASLAVATYPSLTELSRVKNVTSAIQTQINGKLNLTGGSLSGALNESNGADIASAATTDIGAATGNYVVVTGTTTITALGTVQAGTRRIVNFSGILTLTHNGTSLILPTAANITTAAGDTATFVSLGSGNWVCTNYMRASGAALVGGGSNTQTLTCIGLVIVTVNDATNYHIGTIAATPAGTDARRAFKPTANCTVTAASLTLEQVINGSNETVSIYLRNVTDATETLIGTFTSDFGASTTLKTLFSGLSISLVTTKDYTIRITTPTWGTNPSQWIPAVTLQMTL